MFKKLEKNEKGFTLVELVVVIAILAILAVLLVPKIMGNVDEARASRHTANARTIASEISTYNAQGTYWFMEKCSLYILGVLDE